MAHQWLRCNLLASDFPLLTDLFGESVIIKSIDEQGSQNDAELFYCENVMPTSAGYQSVGFINRNPNGAATVAAPGHGAVDYAYNLSYADAGSGNALLSTYMATSITDFTGLYVFENFTLAWHWCVLPGAIGTILPHNLMSTATVQGQTYVCSAFQGVYHYRRSPGPVFLADALIGITATNLIGIVGSNGLMVGWTATEIVWSSNQNPLDFTPSLVTGAGGGGIGEVKGDIRYCVAIAGGFLIYTSSNIVQASYTGNVSFPFKFQEVPGSGGIFSAQQIAFHDNSDNQFVWTDKGLQSVQVGQIASSILTKLSEFLTAGYYETFDPATGIFTDILSPLNLLQPIVNFIASRYLCISYGSDNAANATYSYCLILDVQTGRVGKAKINHTDTLDNSISVGSDIFEAAVRIGFINKAGLVQSLDLRFNSSVGPTVNDGLIILGKFQLQRNKGVYHQRTKLEVTYQGLDTPPTVSIMPSLNGKNFLTPVATTRLNLSGGSGLRVFAGRVYGLNISILITGPFNLSSVETDLVLGAQDMRYT